VAAPGWSDSSAQAEAPDSIADRRFSGGPAFEGHVVSLCKALFTVLGAFGASRTASVFGGFVQWSSGALEAGSI
jgi:hypothetical protein